MVMCMICLNLCIFCVILLSKRSSGTHYQYTACEPKNCSYGPNISFPFYISGVQEPYCGSPGFTLNCGRDGFPVLRLPRNDYIVDDIFYQNKSLHVYIAAVLESSRNHCLPASIKNTAVPAEFSYVNSTELYLFQKCKKPLPEALFRYNVSCGINSSFNNWDLALYREDENLRTAMGICGDPVVAPVELDDGHEGITGIVKSREVLRRGLVLKWTAGDCSVCENSGGRCGFDLTSSHFRCFCPDRPQMVSCKPGKNGIHFLLKVVLPAVTALTSTSLLLFVFIRRKYTLSKLHRLGKAAPDYNDKDIELFLKSHGNLALRRYKYSNLKTITKSFNESLGKGGYGSVYQGKLPDGRLVAVKILNESKGNGEEFINEVASISRTSHINIVTLIGFCFEGSKRALVYEFMPNGSLDKFLQNTDSSSGAQVGRLGWQKLFDISVGVARGLEYLHRLCNMRIVHFDIKPHNILLDKDFQPKISDFGLAKLCPNRSSIVSMLVARGTIGYIAPEVFCRNFGEVSHKSDVYSYGMMVLEIAGGKKNIDPRDVDRSSEIYFPQCIYKKLEAENLDGIVDIEEESKFVKRKLMIVGLWCIQTDPKDRPSMSKVVEMLEGRIEDVQVPPKPYLSSPPRPVLPKFSTSESM